MTVQKTIAKAVQITIQTITDDLTSHILRYLLNDLFTINNKITRKTNRGQRPFLSIVKHLKLVGINYVNQTTIYGR